MVVFPSCEKLKQATTFKVKFDLPEGHFAVDSASLLKSEKILFSQTLSVNIDSIAGNASGIVKEVHFYKLRFSVASPDWVKLDWLSSARATITPAGGSPINFAPNAVINSADGYIDFQLADKDVLPALKGSFTITFYGTLNGKIPVTSVEVLSESGIEITLSPLG
jgi:hypothetical protein